MRLYGMCHAFLHIVNITLSKSQSYTNTLITKNAQYQLNLLEKNCNPDFFWNKNFTEDRNDNRILSRQKYQQSYNQSTGFH
jgi:hypothetical protein